jgi:hypothetical protein
MSEVWQRNADFCKSAGQADAEPGDTNRIQMQLPAMRPAHRLSSRVDLHNTEVECPHCQRTTTLLVPSPSARVRKADSLPPTPIRAESAADEEESQSTLTCCLILSVLIPFVGFFCGVWLMTKKETGYGVACMGTSIFVVIMILVFMSS